MFLTTSKFKFLHVKNHTGPGLSYDAWCKSIGCILQNVLFPYMNVSIVTKNNVMQGLLAMKTLMAALIQRTSINSFLKCSRKMTAPHWVIGCEYIIFQTCVIY